MEKEEKIKELKILSKAIKEAASIINIDEDIKLEKTNIKKLKKEIVNDEKIITLTQKEKSNINDK